MAQVLQLKERIKFRGGLMKVSQLPVVECLVASVRLEPCVVTPKSKVFIEDSGQAVGDPLQQLVSPLL